MKKLANRAVYLLFACLLTVSAVPNTIFAAAKPAIAIKSVTATASKISIKLSANHVVKVVVRIDGKICKTLKKNFKSFSIAKKLKSGKHTLKITGYAKSGKSTAKSKSFTVAATKTESYGAYSAAKASAAPVIDGVGDDICWKNAKWYDIKTNWLADNAAPKNAGDFSGRLKFVYTDNRLYFLAEITDDILTTSTNLDPTYEYANFDCLELFVDEDNSGGLHTFSHQAFAYHLTQSGKAVDLSSKGDWSAVVLDKNVKYTMKAAGNNQYIWEGEIVPFTKEFNENDPDHSPVAKLKPNQVMGISVAYCDSDTQNQAHPKRDHFIGSNNIPSNLLKANLPNQDPNNPKNICWITADAFGKLTLKP